MPKRRDLTFSQGNTEQFTVSVTLDGVAYDLTGAALTCVIKADAATDDASADATLTIGDGVEVLVAAAGTVLVTVPSSVLTVAGLRWYRLDVVKDGAVRTAIFGPLFVTDL